MKLELSTWSIVKTILILFGFWILWEIRDILALLFVVLIVVAALRPSVHWFVERKIPRIVAVSFLIFLIIASLIVILSLIIPAVIDQLQTFILSEFPVLVHKLTPYYESITQGKQLLSDLIAQLQKVSGNILSSLISIFGGIVSVLTIIVMSFYLLLDEHPISQAGLNLLSAHYREPVTRSFERITDKLGAWLRGQFLLSFSMGILAAIGMSLIGVPAPLAVGLSVGLLEIVPIVGPLISGIIIIVMAATSPDAALVRIVAAVIFAAILQFTEGHFLVPNVMRQAIGLSPVVVILALIIGAKLGGITGAIIAVPLAAILQVMAEDWPTFQAVREITHGKSKG